MKFGFHRQVTLGWSVSGIEIKKKLKIDKDISADNDKKEITEEKVKKEAEKKEKKI